MSEPEIDRLALEQLAGLLLERAGLKITPDGYYGLRMALKARMPALGISDSQEYVRRLKQLAGEQELRALLPLVTVGKTDFFRDTRQFGGLETVLMPALLRESRQTGRPVRIWSAGCATGEEPYSLSMVALEQGAQPGEVDIWATDLNPLAVETAAQGFFPLRRMGGVSEARQDRFFTPEDAGFRARPEVKALIRFEGHNLASPVFPGVLPESLDLILCRNVIIYFDQQTIQGLMDRFWEALRPGGVLLLGYSESLFRLPTRFEMFELEGTFAYRRALPGAPLRRPRARPPAAQARPTPAVNSMPARASAPLPPEPPRASAPLPPPPPSVPRPSAPPRPSGPQASAPRPPAPRASAPLPPPPPPAPSVPEVHRPPIERLEAVIALVEAGDFPHALLAAQRLVHDHPDDLGGLLTLGNIHALMGSPQSARESFTAALAREPLCVEARLYLGVAALQEGAAQEARSELKRALFLEPTLALGHYLLGQAEERLGDKAGALRSYRNAVAQRRAGPRSLLGHFPDLPRSAEAVAQAAQFRLSALADET